MRTVHWTLPAILDAQEAWDHIAADNESAAERVLDRVVEATNRLTRFPLLGRPGPETGMRQLVIPRTPYKAFYRLTDSGVDILRLLHEARNWPPTNTSS